MRLDQNVFVKTYLDVGHGKKAGSDTTGITSWFDPKFSCIWRQYCLSHHAEQFIQILFGQVKNLTGAN